MATICALFTIGIEKSVISTWLLFAQLCCMMGRKELLLVVSDINSRFPCP